MQIKTVFVLLFFVAVACQQGQFNEPPKEPKNTESSSLLTKSRKYQNTHFDSALYYARLASDLAQKDGDNLIWAKSQQMLGVLYEQAGDYYNATLAYTIALQKATQLDDWQMSAVCALNLGDIYQRTGTKERSLTYYFLAKHQFVAHSDAAGMASLHTRLGHFYEKEQQYDSALYFQKLAMDYFSVNRDTLSLALTHENIGSIYEDQENYALAQLHFESAFNLNEAIGNNSGKVINLNNLGDIYRKTGNMEEALAYTLKTLNLAIENQQLYEVKSAHRDLFKIYQAINLPEKAIYHLDLAYQLTENLFTAQMASDIARMQSLYEVEQQQQRIGFLENQEIMSQRIYLIASVASVVIILLMILLLILQRSRNDKKRQLLETEIENKELRENQLQFKLSLQENNLTSGALHMMQKNKVLQEMRSKLKELKVKNEDQINKRIKKLVKTIDRSFHDDQDWKEFEKTFNQVHNEFYNQLHKTHPGLSPSEARLCAMLKLNLQSKEIASLLGISPDSLRIFRYRLRKRLRLSKKENLYQYIQQIGNSQ